MALSSKIINIVDDYVNNFLSSLSTKYNIEKDELILLWNDTDQVAASGDESIQVIRTVHCGAAGHKVVHGPKDAGPLHGVHGPKDAALQVDRGSVAQRVDCGTASPRVENKNKSPGKVQSTSSTVGSPSNKNGFDKLSKKELINLCKSKKIKCTGTKEMLIEFLIKEENGSSISSKKSTEKAQQKLDFNIKQSSKNPLSKPSEIKLKKNIEGNYFHSETNFIFDKETKKVIGKQVGSIINTLKLDDIENCKKFNFDYDVPLNLDDESIPLEDDEDDINDDELIEEIFEEEEEEDDEDD